MPKDITLEEGVTINKITVEADNTVGVHWSKTYKEKTGGKKQIAHKDDYHILKKGDDITKEDVKVQAVCNAVW